MNNHLQTIPFVLVILVMSCLSCKTTDRVKKVKPYIEPTKENVSFVGVTSFTGYIYNLYQEKCPGTTISERNSPCIRIGNLITKKKLKNISEIIENDTLSVRSNATYVLDSNKLLFALPSDFFSRTNINFNSKHFEEASFYLEHLLRLKEEENCSIKKERSIRIKECELNSEKAIVLSLSADMANYITSPDIGIANFGMPIEFDGDSLKVAWLVPQNSSILKQIPKKNN